MSADERRVPEQFWLPLIPDDDNSHVGEFCSPQNSEARNDDECLQPNPRQLKAATVGARVYWGRLAEKALSHYRRGLLPQHVDPCNMLGRVPTVPNEPGSRRILTLDESSTTSTLFLEAHSTFGFASNEGCTVGDNIKTIPALLQLGIQSPTPVDWNGTSFRQWVGIEGENTTRNYISILALGWSYILSVRLLETQGQGGAEIAYTQSIATGYKREAGDGIATGMTVDIGDVDEHAARWWAAILAPGQGWKAIFSRNDDVVYLSPWSVCVEDEQRFDIAWGGTSSPSQDSVVPTPPSSKNAFELLSRFCLLHDLGSQCFAALATTLTFPTLNHYGIVATLPFPTDMRGRDEDNPVKLTVPDLVRMSEGLPYYMALSCNHSVIVSSLCGVFWEPRIPCNLVSPWLHPVMNEVPIMEEVINFKGRYHEILAIMCAIRRPKLSALWLGAVTSGLAPRILDFVKGGAPPLDPNAFAWTGCPQSFMDLAGSGPYFQTKASGEKIQRADAWRLLFLPTVVEDDLHYENYPLAPWEPVGKTSAENCMARIRIHRFCSRHHLTYQHWAWHLRDGSILVDQGLETVPAQHSSQEVTLGIEMPASAILPAAELSLDQKASRRASWEIFQWVTANGEGIPADELVYKDEWLRDETISEAPSSHQDDATDSHIRRLSSSTISRSILDGDKVISPKTTLGTTSSIQKVSIDSWFKGLHSEGEIE
ncbi:MAG: hypothetical protein Q9207_008392 [Kuettlingeria erythrocarpa]